MKKIALLGIAGLFAAGVAGAADVDVDSNITTSETWTSDNVYHLKDVIYVKPGASLTIEAGTKVVGYDAAELGQADSSALVVTRGGQIFANGTADNPIVMTSNHDDGTWRPANSEWGNLTILGEAIIAEATNTGGAVAGSQDGTCWDNMEGLGTSADSEYGGNDDDDYSGVVRYVSLRFGGSVVGPADELNGLSLGGIGSETVFDHVEIMNNVDDGIEIWGGCPQLKYVSIWNIGDDSFDLDEGFRGKAQFGLIVQGFATLTEDQGSGNGDNCFEMDGAENPDNMQPFANPQIQNFTVIGQPTGGDQGLAFRDNMRIQVGNSIFMDIGERLIKFEGSADDLMFDAFVSLAHDSYVDPNSYVDFTSPDMPYSTLAEFYPASRSGNWSWLKDCVFYNIADDSDINYDDDGDTFNETTGDLGLWTGMGNTRDAANLPIVSIDRYTDAELVAALGLPPGTTQPLGMELVQSLDPRAANDALNGSSSQPDDSGDAEVHGPGFFTQVPYIGAFSADVNWLEGWTAADEFGMLANTGNNPSDPSGNDLSIEVEVISTTYYQTENGVVYTVEESSDGVHWTPVETVTGDGTLKQYADLDGYDVNKQYRVIAQ